MRRSVQRQRNAAESPRRIVTGLHSTMSRAYDTLPPEDTARTVDAALTLLEEIGVRFEQGTAADSLLAGAGCRVGNGVVKIPAPVVRTALDTCAKSTRLWNRDGTRAIDIDKDHTWFMPGMTCIKVFDDATGEPRDSTRADLAAITRLADGLENIDAVCVACKDVPDSTLSGEIGEF